MNAAREMRAEVNFMANMCRRALADELVMKLSLHLRAFMLQPPRRQHMGFSLVAARPHGSCAHTQRPNCPRSKLGDRDQHFAWQKARNKPIVAKRQPNKTAKRAGESTGLRKTRGKYYYIHCGVEHLTNVNLERSVDVAREASGGSTVAKEGGNVPISETI